MENLSTMADKELFSAVGFWLDNVSIHTCERESNARGSVLNWSFSNQDPYRFHLMISFNSRFVKAIHIIFIVYSLTENRQLSPCLWYDISTSRYAPSRGDKTLKISSHPNMANWTIFFYEIKTKNFFFSLF